MSSSADVISRAVAAIRKQQEEIAVASCMQPKTDLHGIGIQVGRYQGLDMAVETINFILRETEDKE